MKQATRAESSAAIKGPKKLIGYSLGYSTPICYEEVKFTDSKDEADDWVTKPAWGENVMNVYSPVYEVVEEKQNDAN